MGKYEQRYLNEKLTRAEVNGKGTHNDRKAKNHTNKDRDIILADNKSLHSQVENIKTEYKEKEFDLDWNYKKQIEHEEKEKELSYER